MGRWQKAVWAVGMVFVLGGLETGMAPANASAPPVTSTADRSELTVESGNEGWYVLAPDGMTQKVQPGSARTPAPEPDRSSRLLDLWAWGQCWTLNDSNFAIKSYDWWWNGQKTSIDLKCGFHDDVRATGSGYKHIAAGHQKDWQAKLDQIGDARYSWDDVMASGVYAAMTYPEYTTAQAGQKRCAYGILVYLTNKGIQQQFEPTVVWSENNKLIITAIPKTKGSC